MLFAASESAVTKKPRLRLTMRRSSSVSPLGFFQREMSRDMLISCGIQWLAQVARYFSQAHLYLNGTSWLTSVLPLMMRLSATLTRCAAAASPLCRLAACRSEEHTSELQSLMRISYAVFCLKKKTKTKINYTNYQTHS